MQLKSSTIENAIVQLFVSIHYEQKRESRKLSKFQNYFVV